MPRRLRAALAAVLLAIGAVMAAGDTIARGPGTTADAAAPAPEAARARELLRLLKQDCGSCHGMRLTGGLGPALTPEALRAKPATSLVATIVSGRPGTAMPSWYRFVSEPEAQWIVTRLLTGATDESR